MDLSVDLRALRVSVVRMAMRTSPRPVIMFPEESMERKSVGILIFPNVEVLDFCGPRLCHVICLHLPNEDTIKPGILSIRNPQSANRNLRGGRWE